MRRDEPQAPNRERIFIALGSNLGDRVQWLQQARDQVSATAAVTIVHASPLYETAPIGKLDQPLFINQVIEIRATLPPEALLARLLQIELAMGRERHERWGPRNIDLDLLTFGAQRRQTAQLQLPHPELHRRRFVLTPWADIAPEFEVTGLHATVQELLQQCSDHARVQELKN